MKRRKSKRTKSILVSLIIVLSTFAILDFPPNFVQEVEAPPPSTIYVDDDAPNDPEPNDPLISDPDEDGSLSHPFDMIQEGINATNPGDTVFVYNGTFYEDIVINKTITLVGESKINTIIDGIFPDVVTVEAHWVNITGFTIKDGWRGIKLHDYNRCNISSNKVIDGNVIGIGLSNSNNNIIRNNEISNSDHGIHISSSNRNSITNNVISNDYGITCDSSSENKISGNNIFANLCGIDIFSSICNDVTDNEMTGKGIFIDGYLLEHWNTHNIDITNTINGKPVTYLKNQTGGIIPPDVGQIILANCNNVMIENQNLSYGPVGIELGFSTYNYVLGNTLSFNNYRAIFLESSNNNHIMNNNITNNGKGVYINSSSNIDITSNTVSSSTQNGLYFYNSHNNNVVSNNIFSNSGSGIEFSRSQKNTITGNDISSNDLAAIALDSTSSDSVITENILSFNYGGIYSNTESVNHTITNNNIIGNTGSGILIGTNSTVINNNVFNNEGGITISSRSLAKWNTVAFSNGTGITFDISCIGSTAIYNKIYSNNVSGVKLHDCFENNVTCNVISGNRYGINIFLAQDINIIGNTISSNTDYGIFNLDYSFNIKIYHNNLINNTIQACDDALGTSGWDNGYPSGGNYWSDYTGVDEKSGPGQDLPGSDGLGDTPYSDIIGGSESDGYPLMHPYQNQIQLNAGWNFISTPLIQSESDLDDILNSIEGSYDTIWYYNGSNKNNPWSIYNSFKPFGNSLTVINEKMGFWVHVSQPGSKTLFLDGSQPRENQTILLQPGWNLVGFPSLSNKTRTEALNNLDYSIDIGSIWTWDVVKQKWEEIQETDYFEVGRGYWIYSNVEKVWYVPL